MGGQKDKQEGGGDASVREAMRRCIRKKKTAEFELRTENEGKKNGRKRRRGCFESRVNFGKIERRKSTRGGDQEPRRFHHGLVIEGRQSPNRKMDCQMVFIGGGEKMTSPVCLKG